MSNSTQSVYDAFNRIGLYNETDRLALSAALVALADLVTPLTDDPEFFVGNCCERVLEQEREEVRAAILEIAAELKGGITNTDTSPVP